MVELLILVVGGFLGGFLGVSNFWVSGGFEE